MKIQSRIPTAVAAVLLVTAGPTTAQEPRRVTLDEALALFARDNLELRLARAEAAEATALAEQAAAYPNPTVSGTRESLSDAGRGYSESYLDLSQRLEWPPTRSARRDAAEQAAAAARARLGADSARLAFEVKRAYTEAVRAERAERVLARIVEVFREGARSAQERYGDGDVSLYELRRIRHERARYATRDAEAGLDAAEVRRRLATLVAPADAALELAPADALAGPPPAVTAEDAAATALARRGEVAAAEAGLQAALARASVARAERTPDVTATAGYKRQSDGFGGAFLGLSLPVPLWDRRGGAVEAARARVAAAESRLALARRQVENDVRRALDAYRSLARRAELFEASLAEDATDLLEVAQVAYDEGEMELIELLDAAEALLEARLAEARLRAEFWTRYYDLERAVGGFDGSADGREDR